MKKKKRYATLSSSYDPRKYRKKPPKSPDVLFIKKFQEATSTKIDLSHDDPEALALLIHYFYNFALPATLASDVSSTHLPTLLVKIYAIADKYNVQPLVSLARSRLASIYDPAYTITNIPAYVSCVRAVDENTSDEPESRGGLWGILLFVARANMAVLLKSAEFRGLVGGDEALGGGLWWRCWGCR